MDEAANRFRGYFDLKAKLSRANICTTWFGTHFILSKNWKLKKSIQISNKSKNITCFNRKRSCLSLEVTGYNGFCSIRSRKWSLIFLWCASICCVSICCAKKTFFRMHQKDCTTCQCSWTLTVVPVQVLIIMKLFPYYNETLFFLSYMSDFRNADK